MTVAQLIEQANTKAKRINHREFARKASDRQMLQQLTLACRALVNAASTHGDVRKEMVELKTMTVIAENRLK